MLLTSRILLLPFLPLPLFSYGVCGARCRQRVALDDNTLILVIVAVVVMVVVVVVVVVNVCLQSAVAVVVVGRAGYVVGKTCTTHAGCLWAADNIFAVSSRGRNGGAKLVVASRGSAEDACCPVGRGWCCRRVLLWVRYAVGLEAISTA